MTKEDLDNERFQLFQNLENAEALAAEFVKTELSTGFTFVQASNDYQSRREYKQAIRVLALAEEALSQSRKFLSLARFPEQERTMVERRMEQLERLVMRPAEPVPTG